MIIDGCQSSYDSYIRLYRYETYTERRCINPGLGFGRVCFDMPKSRWTELSSNDDHNGRCHSPSHGYASFLELTDLVPGGNYALVVEGFGNSEGQYSVSLSCPTLEATLNRQTGNNCQYADVRLDNGLAYVWDGSDWDEICGHWFWNNNNGATAVCNRLGYSSGTWTRTNEYAPDGQAFMIGSCNNPSDFPNCYSQPNCNGGDAPTIRITCDGNSAITANSCGTAV